MQGLDRHQSGCDQLVSAEAYLPAGRQSIATLRAAAEHCEGCDLHERATQTVFGEGRVRTPPFMLFEEQPGDVEDRTEHPFVGPAGNLLNEALDVVGLDRGTIYVTNAVKHFK
jgi:uracil-DNA glycosylase